MTRSFHQFQCEDEQLIGTLDSGNKSTGLLIVGGGNEIRSGAHAGMARLAHLVAKQGFPVFRFDRRGIGESSGENQAFLSSEADIKAAAVQFRRICPDMTKIVAFGNCDAASALAFFGPSAGIEAYVLANPWVIEANIESGEDHPAPNAAAIRSRYWDRLKNPRSIIDLLTGKINIAKLFKGLKQASKKQENTALAIKFHNALVQSNHDIEILLANRDTTALAFLAAWKSEDYAAVRDNPYISVSELGSASHSFADAQSKKWLEERILTSLHRA